MIPRRPLPLAPRPRSAPLSTLAARPLLALKHRSSPASSRSTCFTVVQLRIPVQTLVKTMTTLTPRRPHSTQAKGKERAVPEQEHDHDHDHAHEHEHTHEHEHEHDHSHTHSHSVFSFGHSHSHADGGHGGAEKVVEALKGGGDRGSRITLIGLASNVGLTVSKGFAGWYMNSAALLADAGHTAGDLIGDLITLFCWRLSRRPPSELYPYGFGKFEVLGTVAVSLLLTGGAFLLGYHSLAMLLDSLAETAATLPPGAAQELLLNVTHIAHAMPNVEAGHAHEHALDPNAAWFAAVGVLVKEVLYRATKRVADDENSPVLFANALHHRSDAYGSAVALVAILGTWWLPHLPLDQLGGLLVSVLIVQQGWGITVSAFQQLTDASVTPQTKTSLLRALEPLTSEQLLGIRDLRATRAGALMFVDLTASVPQSLSIVDASSLEAKIARTLKEVKKEIQEVRVKFEPAGTE